MYLKSSSLLKKLLKMDMLTQLKDLSTSISNSIRPNLSIINSKKYKGRRPKLPKLINWERSIKMTLPFGKQQNQENQNGTLLGDKEDLAGILNAQQWLIQFLDKTWIFTQGELTWSFLITRMRWLNHKLIITIQTGWNTLFMSVTWRFLTQKQDSSKRCQNQRKTFSPFNKY